MATRYYFHGDEVEGKQGHYYCAYCDSFVNENHFSDILHSDTDKAEYDFFVKDWKTLGRKAKARLHRPSNTYNLFANLPKSKKPKISPFYRWLVKQQDRDDSIGDLATNIQKDKSFPVESSSLKISRKYLIRKFASDEAIHALEEAHREFQKNKTTRSSISPSLRFDILCRDNRRCRICGATADDGVRLEIDHIVPVAKGGTDDMSNLWTLCFECNRGKGTKDL